MGTQRHKTVKKARTQPSVVKRTRTSPTKRELSFIDRTLILTGLLMLGGSVYSFATGDYGRAVPALSYGAVGVYWWWHKR